MSAPLQISASHVAPPRDGVSGDRETLERREPSSVLEHAEKGSLWVIAEGIGSPARALQASRLAAHTVATVYWESALMEPAARLRVAIGRANALLVIPRRGAVRPEDLAGATILAVAIRQDTLFLAHVGRARAYLLRDGDLRQLTDDHVWAAEQARAGALTPEEAARHPQRNAITRCLGVRTTVVADGREERLVDGDVVLLCSHALTRCLDDARVADLLARHRGEAAPALVEEARRAKDDAALIAVTIAVRRSPAARAPLPDQLVALTQSARQVATSLDLDATLRAVLERALAMTAGERAAVLLVDETGALSTRAAHRVPTTGAAAGYSRNIAQRVIQTRGPVVIADALNDLAMPVTESVIGQTIRSVVCAPLIVGETAIGALYIDSTREPRLFDPGDLDLLVMFAGQAAAAIHNADLHAALAARAHEIEAIQRRQALILRALDDAVIGLTLDHRVTLWNRQAEVMLGLPAATAVGHPLTDLLPASMVVWLTHLIVQTGSEHQTIVMGENWKGRLPARGPVVLSGKAARVRDVTGTDQGYVLTLSDHTEAARLEDERRSQTAAQARLRGVLDRYLAPPLVERLLQTPDELKLGGARQAITVLFADIRGFTSFSERHAPEDVVGMLNQFLALATTEIFGQEGTLDKFLGDGVMALFGAPAPLVNHALAAARAAVGMRARIEELRRQTGIRVGFGIGLNSGEAIVGNIGTPQLMAYTAIGDDVNVAARLQAEARSGEILVSDATLALLGDQAEVEELGSTHVKGRSAPVTIYKLTRLRDEPPAS